MSADDPAWPSKPRQQLHHRAPHSVATGKALRIASDNRALIIRLQVRVKPAIFFILVSIRIATMLRRRRRKISHGRICGRLDGTTGRC